MNTSKNTDCWKDVAESNLADKLKTTVDAGITKTPVLSININKTFNKIKKLWQRKTKRV